MSIRKSTIALPLLSLAITLLIVEALVRLIGLSSGQPPTNDRPLFYYKESDAQNMIGPNYSNDKKTGVFRLSIVGDSFTFAPMVQYDDTFPAKLGRILNLNKGEQKAEVINLGTPGFSTKDEIKLVEQAVRAHSDLIILQITLNDAELRMFGPEDAKRRAFGRLKITAKETPLLYYWKTAGFIASRIHNTLANNRYKEYFLNIWNSEDSWNNFKNSIQEINAICQHNNIKLVAVVFPIFGFTIDDSHPFLSIHSKIGSLLDSLGITKLDLFDTYRGMNTERLQILPGFDTHPNEIALRLAAEKTYAFLAENKLIPEPLVAKSVYRERRNTKVFESYRCKNNPVNLDSCSKNKRTKRPPAATQNAG